jgi:AraC-like DNA-binding protein
MPHGKDAALKNKMVSQLEFLALGQGHIPSLLPGVTFIRADKPTQRSPVAYEPSIVLVAQGSKQGYVGDEVFRYDAYNYLVLSVPLPFECRTEASPEKPLLALSIKVDPTSLLELLSTMEETSEHETLVPLGFYASPLNEELISAAVRLLECLHSSTDTRVLGTQIVREIIYRVLCGEQGGALRAVASMNSRFGRIARVLRRIHLDYQNRFDIETLAREVNMGTSTFHSCFKSVTAVSPLQYLKSVRLHKARLLMMQDGLNVSTAAYKVGYESASQFSREFKRFFGNNPIDDAARMKKLSPPI